MVTIEKGKTFSWGGKYSDDYSTRDTLYTDLGVFENYTPNIPESVETEYLYLGNIQPSLQLDVINKIKSKQRIVSDTMNLWIDLDLNGLWEVIKLTNIFLLNDEEAMQLTGKKDLHEIGKQLLESGPDTVIIKKVSNVDSGQIAVVLIDDQEATLKRVRKKGNTIALEAANRNYGTKIYAANRIKIQGKLVSLYRNFH